jgi:cytoskeletal protein CcmA (bactofilin family)
MQHRGRRVESTARFPDDKRARPGIPLDRAHRQLEKPAFERGSFRTSVGPMQAPVPDIELTALLGRGTRFDGKLHFEGRVRIDGTFRGEIKSDGTLVIGEGARVHADVHVGTLIVKGGTLAGIVEARQSIELHVPAQVTGQLRAPEIFMDKGVQFSGECTIVPA